MVKIGVLISGGGSNLQALIDSSIRGYISGKIDVVISNRHNAYGLKRANKYGIENFYLDRKKFNDDNHYNREIIKILKDRKVDLVVLAGYLNILSEEFVKLYENKIINIHPSLIPSFCGRGYYGEKVHRAILDYGVKITGATVHFVNRVADDGPIIIQEAVKVNENETLESLKTRVQKVEHEILTRAIRLYCEGRIKVIGRKVLIK